MEDCLEKFGKEFIKDVRDRSIRIFDKTIQGAMKDDSSQKLYEKINLLSDNEKKMIYEIIPQIVDLSMHNMLSFFEEHKEFQIIVDKQNLNEMSDGLAGELYTSDGWISKFSEQRYSE